MTTELNDCIERYTISGTGPYTFSFRIFEDGDLAVTALESGDVDPVTLTLNTDYTVTGENDEDGGSLTLSAGAASAYASYTLDIRSNTPIEQPTSIKNQGTFAPIVHEKAFDRLNRQLQDVYRQLKQCFRYPDNVNLDAKMTSRSAWLSKYLFVNSSGVIEPASSIGSTALTQTLIGETLCPRTAAEIAASVTPVNYYHAPGNVLRYGTNTTPGTTDMTAAVQAAIDSNYYVYFPNGTYLIDTVTLRTGTVLHGDGFVSIIKQNTTTGASYGTLYANSGSSSAYVENINIHDLRIEGPNIAGNRARLSGISYFFRFLPARIPAWRRFRRVADD